jgi:hypothetical protein
MIEIGCRYGLLNDDNATTTTRDGAIPLPQPRRKRRLATTAASLRRDAPYGSRHASADFRCALPNTS